MLIETRVGRLFVDVRGEGDAIVLWPSLLTDGGMWRFQVPRLAERWRVVTIDPPGHGRSGLVHEAFTLEDCAGAVLEIMDALAIESACFAGLSWGGMIGMRLALASPQRVRSLALIDSNADREARKKVPSYRAMMLIARLFGPGVPRLLDRIEPLYFTASTRRHRRELVEDFREHVASRDPVSLGHCLDAVIFDRADIRDRLSSLRVPTLVLVGADDVATPIERSRDIASRIPGAELVVIPDAAHLSALEAPERITQELVRFFAR
jgi:3-oxoadipate enol-lactonase